VGGGKALGVLVAVAPVWPPSWLAEGAAPLARAWVAVMSTIRILSTSGVGSRHIGSSGRVVACLLADKHVPSLRHLVLGVGLPSMGMHSLPLLKSVSSLKGVAGVWP
jgi:hypothetical protein